MQRHKTDWSVGVSACFALFTYLASDWFAESLRRPLAVVAAIALILSCLGWLVDRIPALHRLRAKPGATHPMTLFLIACFGAGLAMAVWFLAPTPEEPPAPITVIVHYLTPSLPTLHP